MTIDQRLFPRVTQAEAHDLRKALLSREDPEQAFDEALLSRSIADPAAYPPTGGPRMREDDLLSLRQEVFEEIGRTEGGSSAAGFDLAVGRVLYADGTRSRGELANARVWDFLSLVVLPDLAALRVRAGRAPDAPLTSSAGTKRLTGGDRRHVLQRLWKRWTVFGPDMVSSQRLSEDDYVAMLERRITLERREVAREAAARIVGSGFSGGARRDYTRLLMRQLVQLSGIVEISGDDPDHLSAVFGHLDGLVRGTIARS